MKSTKLSNPITSTANKIASLFAGNPGISTKLFFEANKLKIYYVDVERAEALASVLKTHYKLGNLHLDVEVYKKVGAKKYKKVEGIAPAKGSEAVAKAIMTALDGCPSFFGSVKAKDPHGIYWYFILGSKEGCQYQNDDIQNPWLVTTVLPQDVMKFCLNHKGVQISTHFEKAKKSSKKIGK